MTVSNSLFLFWRMTLSKLFITSILVQVRFGILEAGAYGVSQSRKRAFVWAASPEETLPEWPEPMHVFASRGLKISTGDSFYVAAKSTIRGAPLRSLTVKDTIGDLPPVGNGASLHSIDVKFSAFTVSISFEYKNSWQAYEFFFSSAYCYFFLHQYKSDPVSWFQRKIRGNMTTLNDHISKEMNELNLIRCQRVPKRPGADWHSLPKKKKVIKALSFVAANNNSVGTIATVLCWFRLIQMVI